MGQELLQYPYSFEERRPTLINRVFFLPPHYFGELGVLSWESPKLFGNHHPVHIEYCSGNGEWIIDRALRYPQWNWVAVEKKFKRVRKIYAKREKRQLKNLAIVAGDAIALTKHCLALNSVAAIYINFPDPWPKKKHAKHRLIQEEFVDNLSQVVLPAGTFTLVTDHSDYWEQIRVILEKVAIWKAVSVPARFEEEYGSSYFDRLWRSKGLPIRFLAYQKKVSARC
ncbi:MAG: tRNA (guanosine(46)-N7)-methyltransferase TrmB [Chlamydiota bacterium]